MHFVKNNKNTVVALYMPERLVKKNLRNDSIPEHLADSSLQMQIEHLEKQVKVIDKVDRVVDNVEEKVNSFNGALAVMSKAADGIASVSDSVINGVSLAVTKLINKFNKKKKEEDFYE